MHLIERTRGQMKPLFPPEISAEEIDLCQTLAAGPFNVVEIDQFGDARKIGMGPSGKHRMGRTPKGAHINGRLLAAQQECCDAKQPFLVQPGKEIFKSVQEPGIIEVRAFSKGFEVHLEHEVHVPKIVIPHGKAQRPQAIQFTAQLLAGFPGKPLHIFPQKNSRTQRERRGTRFHPSVVPSSSGSVDS